ncbi:hypothetical protein ACQP2T_30495 [Nonomuraea sp. CA-143628]|uniref:hypothetical protein n=1 Tax=Nonomuraea sp. CA-143628 TaxID=3239997 RepID=UPI003D92E9D8
MTGRDVTCVTPLKSAEHVLAPATTCDLSALCSFTTWAQLQELLDTNPARRLERRKPARRGDRAIPRTRLETLFTDPSHSLRERLLWRR